MRKDISVDAGYGELIFEKTGPPFPGQFSWEKEDDYFVYGVCKLSSDLNRYQIEKGSIGVHVGRKDRYKQIKMKLVIPSGSEYIIVRTITGREWFELKYPDGQKVYASELPLISDDFFFRFVLKDELYISKGYMEDLRISASLVQNEMFLLKCCPGNLYAYPMTGIALESYLHGNLESARLGELIKKGFAQDGMYVKEASVNPYTGDVSIEAYEC